MTKWKLAFVYHVHFPRGAFSGPAGEDWATYQVYGDIPDVAKGVQQFDSTKVDDCITSLLNSGFEPIGVVEYESGGGTVRTRAWSFKKMEE